ncbi:hypothetical protein C7S20_16850 [Christiangramia fulva]|uniref:Outer membrane protein beta-barrel domain-containing protein n=1 Tax=Christiangramia fulva TaxID=2126553 RepID=A0A2R3Z997_9FLAO|nr:hypothetical protein [Christiangramia fulva]AVR46794.1 hypothetical protein C7S20_16850 [Christiangramia fulva]
MKKSVFLAVVAVMTMGLANAQKGNFSVGVSGAVPTGEIKEFTTFNLGADAAYRFNLGQKVQVGALAAYSQFFGDSGEDEFGSWEVEDIQFLPLAASARVNVKRFFAGGDLGYAVGINEGNKGGLYYKPHVGVNFGKLGVLGSYSGINRDGFTVSAVNLGLEYKI